jgi:XRE family transcriptional regulator, stress-response regulator
MVLLRHLLGDALRRLRLRQGRTLREVSASARVSLGYLSEVERGQKEASSELLAAICTALGAPLSQVLREVSDSFALAELQNEPVFTGVREPVIEVAGGDRPQHGPAQVSAGPVASTQLASPAGRRLPVVAGSQLPISAGHLRAGQNLTVPAGAPLPLAPGMQAGDPVFEQVSRTAREITNMVPV